MQTVKQAAFSGDNKHRLWLMRTWADRPKMATIIGLNPSTADAEHDDPTIQSCCRILNNLKFGGFVMLNLFTYVTSQPEVLKAAIERGEGNDPVADETIKRITSLCAATICAWGSWEFISGRVSEISSHLLPTNTFCFGLNRNGSPRHPLYLPANQPIQIFIP